MTGNVEESCSHRILFPKTCDVKVNNLRAMTT